MGDQIVRLHAGASGGGSVHRGDDLHDAVFHRDLDAEAAEFAARLRLHVAEILGVEESGVRIERTQHAVDGRFDQLRIVRLLDILRANVLENVAEQIELPVSIRARSLGLSAGENPRL